MGMDKINHLLAESLPNLIKRISRVSPSVHDSLYMQWAKESVMEWKICNHASVETYGNFPIKEDWAREEMPFATKYIFKFRNAEVSLSYGGIRVGNKWIAESFGNLYHSIPNALCLPFAFLVAKIRRRCCYLDYNERGYVFCGCSAYYHLVSEFLIPTIYALKAYPGVCVVVRRDQYESVKFFREYLNGLSECGLLTSLKIIDADFIQCQNYVFVTRERDSGAIPINSMNMVRDIFLKWGGECSKCHSDRIFITRKTRRFANQEEIEDVARRHGFEIVDTDGMPLQEQIKVFSGSKYIVSNHGAGLTNLIFAQDGIRVLELFPSWCLNDAYFRMSKGRRIDYNCMLATDPSPSNAQGIINIKCFLNHLTH